MVLNEECQYHYSKHRSSIFRTHFQILLCMYLILHNNPLGVKLLNCIDGASCDGKPIGTLV